MIWFNSIRSLLKSWQTIHDTKITYYNEKKERIKTAEFLFGLQFSLECRELANNESSSRSSTY